MKEAIIKILRKWGCCHEWEYIREIRLIKGDDVIGYKYFYICKKCGKMKWVKA